MHGILIDVLIFTAVSIVFVPLFRWAKLGSILAYLLAGILIGPGIFGLIRDTQVILHFSELGVVFLLFIIGLELAPAKLWKLRHSIFGLGLLQVLLTGAVFACAGAILGFPWPLALTAGFGLALSSTAFAVQILEENRQLNTSFGQGAFAILMLQDLAVVPLLLTLSWYAGQAGGDTANGFSGLTILKAIGIISVLILLGRYAIRHILGAIARTRVQEVFTALSLFIVIGTAVLLESVGLSMGLGAFMAGVLLANSEYRHELQINLQPFKGLLLGLFFIAVGMSLNLQAIAAAPLALLQLTTAFMLGKIAIIFVLCRYVFRYSSESARNIAFVLPQGGEFAFVLFNSMVDLGIATGDQGSLLNAAVTISMALTPVTFFLNARFFRTISEISERPYDSIESEGAEVIIAGFGRFGQIIARLLRAEEIKTTILEHDAEQIDTARKFGNQVFYGDASRHDLLESAGAKHAKYFVLAIDDVEASVATAKMVREHFPHLKIIARVRNRRHALQLMELGIESIHRETYLTSLEAAKEVLLLTGRDHELVRRKVDSFRQHDEAMLRNQFQYRNDEEQFVSFTVQASKDLEEILRADTKGGPPA
jgi:glutathione-regulated potassium-efflux system ancillary protein KefC